MKLKKCAMMMAGAMALVVSLNVNAMTPGAYVRAVNTEENITRTVPCAEHEWVYVTRYIGNIVYYNYQCEVCGKYKYSPWLKE